MNADMQRISRLCAEGRARCAKRIVTREDQERLLEEKHYQLRRGVTIMLGLDYAARERWLTEYTSLTRLIDENQILLEQQSIAA